MIITRMLTAAGALFALGVSTAQAIPVTFSSDGGFANISGCGGGFPGCSISGSGNTLDMSGINNSTLTANDFGPVSTNTDANDVLLGQITWVNRASFFTDSNFSVNYALVLNFTAPNADTANQTFNLTVQQPTNPPGDVVSGFVISGLPATFNLNGVAVSDLRFTAGGSGSFAGGVWSNPEGGTSQLRLTGDFTAVPEPATLTLFGAGLLGLAAVKRRRDRSARS